jgi:hypothetical protein
MLRTPQRHPAKNRRAPEQCSRGDGPRAAEVAKKPLHRVRDAVGARARVRSGEHRDAGQPGQKERGAEVRGAPRPIERAGERDGDSAADGAAQREERGSRRAARATREKESAASRARDEREELELRERAQAALAEPQRAGEREEAPGRRTEQHARAVHAQHRREVVGESEPERSEETDGEHGGARRDDADERRGDEGLRTALEAGRGRGGHGSPTFRLRGAPLPAWEGRRAQRRRDPSAATRLRAAGGAASPQAVSRTRRDGARLFYAMAARAG